jgi:predicted acetyltransferase
MIARGSQRSGCGLSARPLRSEDAGADAPRIARALLDTDEGNAASRTTAERAGGVLESVAWSELWQDRICKYRIEVD